MARKRAGLTFKRTVRAAWPSCVRVTCPRCGYILCGQVFGRYHFAQTATCRRCRFVGAIGAAENEGAQVRRSPARQGRKKTPGGPKEVS